MPSLKKIEQVEDLTRFLDAASLVIGASHTGLTVSEMEGLRRALRVAGTSYRVVKNRLALRAADGLERGEIAQVLNGPVGLIVTRDDPMPTIQALSAYIRTTRLPLRITNAVLERRVINATELERIASLPSREVLLAQAMGVMNGVSQRLVGVLNAHVSSIVNILEQRRRQLEDRS